MIIPLDFYKIIPYTISVELMINKPLNPMKSTLSYFEIAQDLSLVEKQVLNTLIDFIDYYPRYGIEELNTDSKYWIRMANHVHIVNYYVSHMPGSFDRKGKLHLYVKAVNYFYEFYRELQEMGKLPLGIDVDITRQVEHCRNYHLL